MWCAGEFHCCRDWEPMGEDCRGRQGQGLQPTPLTGLPEDIRGLGRTVLCHPSRGNLPDLCVTSIMRPVRKGERRRSEPAWQRTKLSYDRLCWKHYWHCLKVVSRSPESGQESIEAYAATLYEVLCGRQHIGITSSNHMFPRHNQ